jgi:hypothetical protein
MGPRSDHGVEPLPFSHEQTEPPEESAEDGADFASTPPSRSILNSVITAVRQDSFLPFLLALTFFSGVFWAAAIPLWDTSDERVHYAYIQDLGEGVDTFLPSERLWPAEIRIVDALTAMQNPRFDYEFYEPFQPDSQYGPQEDEIRDLPRSLREDRNPGEDNTAKSYPPGYYFVASLLYRPLASADVLTIAFSLRVLSAFLTTLTMFFTYLTLKRFFSDEATAKATALIIALSPMYIYAGMAVNADVLVWLFFSIYLYLLTRAFTEGLSPRMNLLIALTVALGLWIKQTVVIAVPFYFVLLIFLNTRGTLTLRRSLAPLFVFLLTVMAFDGWLYLGGAIVQSPESLENYTGERQSASVLGFIRHFYDYWPDYRWVFDTFWGNFGGGANTNPQFQASENLRIASRWGSALAAIGLGVYLIRGASQHRSDLRRFVRSWPGSLTLFYFVITVMFVGSLIAVNYIRITPPEPPPLQPRYFFPLIGPIVGLQVLGLRSFSNATWYKHGLLVALVVGVALSHTDTLFRYIIPHYYT